MVASNSNDLTPARISVTLKGDLQAPWIVVEGNDAAKVTDLLHGVNDADLLTGAATLAATFGKLWTVKLEEVRPSLPGYTAPAAPVNPPQVAPRPVSQTVGDASDPVKGSPLPTNEACSSCGALLVYKTSGQSKKGKWLLYACPNGRSRDDGHGSKFINP